MIPVSLLGHLHVWSKHNLEATSLLNCTRELFILAFLLTYSTSQCMALPGDYSSPQTPEAFVATLLTEVLGLRFPDFR